MKALGNKGLAADDTGVREITAAHEEPLHPGGFEVFLPGLPKHIFPDLLGGWFVRVVHRADLIYKPPIQPQSFFRRGDETGPDAPFSVDSRLQTCLECGYLFVAIPILTYQMEAIP